MGRPYIAGYGLLTWVVSVSDAPWCVPTSRGYGLLTWVVSVSDAPRCVPTIVVMRFVGGNVRDNVVGTHHGASAGYIG